MLWENKLGSMDEGFHPELFHKAVFTKPDTDVLSTVTATVSTGYTGNLVPSFADSKE